MMVNKCPPPDRYKSLWRLGLDPLRGWCDQQTSTSGTSHLEIEQLSERLSKMEELPPPEKPPYFDLRNLKNPTARSYAQRMSIIQSNIT